jgi:4-alpha-glucanotransferase
MKFNRSAGVLLHPTSLPGKFGIGDLGPSAFKFIDFLNETGCKLWQVLPLGPTGFGDSPYQNLSTFAGNPLLISPELLIQDGLLKITDLSGNEIFSTEKVDFGQLIPWKLSILELAYNNFNKNRHNLGDEFEAFCDENFCWLDEYAIFMTLKELQGGGSWINWPESLKNARSKELRIEANIDKSIKRRFKFFQYVFQRQWLSVKNHANRLGIKIIGDLPLYMAHDCADVWANQELFRLDKNGLPEVVAGVPPDCFTPTGQLWGNPIYNWSNHRKQEYAWWIARVKHQLKYVDILRLDHFRGFSGYWEVPASEKTAERGQWVEGPGLELFDKLKLNIMDDGQLPFIAEDLGLITSDVIELRAQLGIPGMKILQFAFSNPDNPFLPIHYTENYIVYTGTHDNETSLGWFEIATNQEKNFLKNYMGVEIIQIEWDLIRLAWASVAIFAIAPMQDFLSLDSRARMNVPGRQDGNWSWRMREFPVEEEIFERLKNFNITYDRI